MRSQALDRASRRIVLIRFAGLAVVLLLAGRAAHLTVAHARARTLYEQQIRSEQRLSASRGTIFDRNGVELAISTEAASIYAMPRLMEDRAVAAETLAEILDLDLAQLAHRLTSREGFTYIARWVETDQAERIRALEIPGIGIDREPRRTYPAGRLAAPLLGFANIDGDGVRGIEQLENDWLVGQPRRVRVERDARGRTLALRSTDPRDVEGGDVALTLDAAMQGAAEAALAEAVERTEAEGGLVLVMDPRNGDVLAMAEAPGFDPNEFRHLDYHETRARAFADAVEAGSTMKAFLVASALDGEFITPDQLFGTEEGFLRVRGKTIRDRRPLGILTPYDVLRLSSNVAAVQIAQAMGREAQYQGLVRFGFGERTRSRFPVESGGILRDWSKWQPVDQAAISYGQGLSVTGIQLASALAALANDGVRMEPRLVLARRRTGTGWKTTSVERHGRAVSARAARLTLDMMQTVVAADGTGRLAGLEGVRVAGKTGTAQKLDRELGRYSRSRYMAWFMGVVPADDPELAIVVAVDEPKGALHSGGGVAAPLFGQVAAAGLARRGIMTKPAPIAPAPLPVRVVDRAPMALPDTKTAEESTRTPAPPSRKLAQRNEPPRAAVAAPPAGPAAPVAAGPSPSSSAGPPPAPSRAQVAAAPTRPTPDAPRRTAAMTPSASAASAGASFGLVFVPDFEGTTMARARRMAERESLVLSTRGAIEGRVVSQVPVPGTVLEGSNRSVQLRFAPHEEAKRSNPRTQRRREEG